MNYPLGLVLHPYCVLRIGVLGMGGYDGLNLWVNGLHPWDPVVIELHGKNHFSIGERYGSSNRWVWEVFVHGELLWWAVWAGKLCHT